MKITNEQLKGLISEVLNSTIEKESKNINEGILDEFNAAVAKIQDQNVKSAFAILQDVTKTLFDNNKLNQEKIEKLQAQLGTKTPEPRDPDDVLDDALASS